MFRNILNFKICHDIALIEEIHDPFEGQYFDEELIHYASCDVFLDCGSYIGDTVEYYRKWSSNSFRKVYAFEADGANYEVLKEKYKDDTRIQPVECGLWDEVGKGRFHNVGSGSGAITGDGCIEINTDTIDHIVGGERVDFIKMDIEGAEYNALVGGRRTIERDMPTLMISAYHHCDDFIRIPLLIKSICPQYQLYFRHYRKMPVQETVCYAIPRRRQKIK